MAVLPADIKYELDQAKVYTMRQLNQQAAAVLDEINRSGQPAVITRHGRFVAMITPLAGMKVESLVLSRESAFVDSLTAEEVRTTSTEEAAADLKVRLPPLKDRYV